MMINDPQKLLTTPIDDNWKIPNRVLEIPPHGIPLHPKSLEKLLLTAKEDNSIIVFQPTLPILSELGLPTYPILAYLYPQQFSNIWHKLQPQIEDFLTGKKNDRIPLTLISEIDIDEQLHYFTDHYGKAINPSYVRVIVGNTCNLKCVMCPYHSSLLKPTHTTDFFQGKKQMSWQMMERLAQDCGKAGITIFIGSVEEPLLHPQIIDFIQLCRQQGVPKVHLTTNGQLLDETRATALLKAGLTSIDISIDAATPETYLKVRGADFNRVESNVINFLKIRDKLGISCEVRTSFVRNQDVTEAEEQLFFNRWLSKVNSIFILNVAEYQQTNMRLKKTNQAVQKSLQYYQQKAQERWPCLFPFIEMAVLPDGRIYYCIETLFRLGFDKDIESLGDYHQQTLQEIWSGELFKQLRRDLILNELEKRTACKDCDMWMSQVINRETKDECQVLSTTVTEIYSQV
ncbi:MULTISPECIES: radical SAM/SPASM domain-containing protein [Okeania]|uniref:Radical SAM protein n=1 Tax=Okeania hirsuta TaxID=1458930 RepID=A0A3N6R5F0_9CYAN|nr:MULTISPECIES: radical SAM protein [Okeania]NET14507.1 radical SAM protein [Okeania sp. SIO1H6]NES78687.1 radical SAM protein [Okeania sp. SIO1H4]NES89494.1 radical SAM protein [Okeania sp. SIO2B9]NET22184.1 radical SAM protein [Okeania sp. SIO1H5]NET95179.1 radical SAM protein [Okeania sp. SIO1H2]